MVEISSQTDDVLDSKASPEQEVKFQQLCKRNSEKNFGKGIFMRVNGACNALCMFMYVFVIGVCIISCFKYRTVKNY